MKVFASKNQDFFVRVESSSGGIFSILATSVLKSGGCVYGAAFDKEWNIVHKRIYDERDLNDLRGSKYAFCNIGNSLTSVKADLAEGRMVLFSGCPCHIAAARKKFGDTHNILLVETVCHGAPMHTIWKRYLSSLLLKIGKAKDDILFIKFRDKCTGWQEYSFSIHFKDGTKYSDIYWHNMYMRTFLENYTLKPGCFKCPFKYPDGSQADITLGDFWGISLLDERLNDDMGISLIIARSEKGEKYSQMLSVEKEFCFSDVIQNNPSIIRSATKPLLYDYFWYLADKYDILIAMKRILDMSYFGSIKARVFLMLKKFLKK